MNEISTKLHLGCGSIILSGWINVDLDSPLADRLLNLTEPLPFGNSSISHIYNEHFIEHITRDQAVSFLKECHRVLSPEGAIRITTPNLRFLTSAYLAGDRNEWGHLWQPNSRCQIMNEGMRSWGHQFIYDAEELCRIIGEAGFKLISFQAFHQSTDPIFSGLESRDFHNELIVEARKSSAVAVQIDFSSVKSNESTWSTNSLQVAQSSEMELVRTALESAARAELIEIQSARIRELEATLATVTTEAELQATKLRSGLRGKIRSFFAG